MCSMVVEKKNEISAWDLRKALPKEQLKWYLWGTPRASTTKKGRMNGRMREGVIEERKLVNEGATQGN